MAITIEQVQTIIDNSIANRKMLHRGEALKNNDSKLLELISELETPPAVYDQLAVSISQTNVTTTSGVLVAGKTYVIDNLEAGDNFSNVGYVAEGTPFVASGTTPTTWTNSTSVLNITDSKPTVTEHVNTLADSTIVYARTGVGVYTGTATASLTLNKTFFPVKRYIGNAGTSYTIERTSADVFTIRTFDDAGDPADEVLINDPLEIRVYP